MRAAEAGKEGGGLPSHGLDVDYPLSRRRGGGFKVHDVLRLMREARIFAQRTSPFEDLRTIRDEVWIEPRLLAEVSYSETIDDRLRAPSWREGGTPENEGSIKRAFVPPMLRTRVRSDRNSFRAGRCASTACALARA